LTEQTEATIFFATQWLLENAKKDGHICSKLKNTRRNVTVLAETCQKLAKFPSLRNYGRV
jgi:LAS superfamily LD-carboxypeptidase LdcB